MDHKLLILVLFIAVCFSAGVNVHLTNCVNNKHRTAISNVSLTTEIIHKKSFDNTTSYLINPKQIDDAERVIGKFLVRLVGPAPNDLTLRIQLSSPSKNADKLARVVCTAIRKKLMEFAQQCKLNETSKYYKKSSIPWINDSTGHWYSEAILQGSLLLSDILRMIDEGSSLINQYVYQQNNSMIVPLNHTKSQEDSIKFPFFGRINHLMDYVLRLSQCVNTTNESRTNKNRKILFTDLLKNLTADPLEMAVHHFKMFLHQPGFPKLYSTSSDKERLQTIFCSFAVQQGILEYADCIEELNRIKECTFKAEDRANSAHTRRLTVAPWLKAIKSLGNCKADYDKDHKRVIIYCHWSISTKYLSTEQKLRFIYNMLKLRNVRVRWMRHVANELGDALSRSQIGNEIINDLYQFCRIYHDGQNKVNRLAKLAAKNKNYYIRHRKVLNSFEEYKRGFLAKTILSIRQAHDSMYALNDLMMHIDPMFFSNWQSYMGVLRSIADWIDCMLELIGITDSDTEDVIEINPGTTPHPGTQLAENKFPEYEENDEEDIYDNGFWELNETANAFFNAADVERNRNLRKAADAAFGKLLRSMKDASNVQVVNTKSTLSSIVNNILLATMFIETVGLVTSLFSYQSIATENGNMQISGPIEPDTDDNEEEIGFDDYDL